MSRALPWLALASLLLTGFALSAFDVHNNDLGYHVSYGRRILQTGAVPTTNVFSSVSEGHPIHDDKWLFQLAVALVDRLEAPWAFVALRMLLVGLLAGLVLGLLREELPLTGPLPWLGASLALWTMSERFLLRPELGSYVLLAAMLWGFERLRRGRGRLWPLILLQVVWVNTHGYFILGPAVAGALMVSALLPGGAGRAGARRWAVAFAWLVGACLANPAGWRGAAYPFITLFLLYTRWERALQIQEFQPSLTPEPFLTHTYLLYCALLVAAPLALLLAWRKQRSWYRPILLVAFVAMSMTIRRNIVLLGLVGTWLALTSLARLERGGRPARAVGWGLLLLLAPLAALQPLTDRLYLAEHRIRRFGFGLSRVAYPAAAVRFVQQQDLPGIYGNNFDVGSYLLWKLGPERPPMLDGNIDAIPIPFQRRYLALNSRREALDAFSDEFGVRFWIVQHGPCDTLDLIGRLQRNPRWRLIYLDALTVVYVRRDALAPERLEALTVDVARQERAAPRARLPEPRPETRYFLRHALSPARTRYPAREAYLGNLYLALGCPRLARAALARALERCRWNPRLYHQAALTLLDRDPARAEAYLRAALALAPDYAVAHHNLARLAEKTGRPAQALEHFRRAFRADPGEERHAAALIAHLQAGGQSAEALRVSARAVRGAPDSAALHRLRGELLEQDGQRELALRHYRRSLALREDQPDLLQRIERLSGNR